MSTWEAFAWGVTFGMILLRLLGSAHERAVERRASIASEHAKLLQQKLELMRAEARELLGARVEIALNFWAMQQAARDEVRS